jgi:hypothetical protein
VNVKYVSKNVKDWEFLPQLTYMRTVRVPLVLEVRMQLLQHTSLASGYYRVCGLLRLHVWVFVHKF